jgi:EAL and modified HD-GYP domain-containing signal transduction protein
MEELSQPEPNFNHITKIIERDVSFSYKILKLINSPIFRRQNEIKSIKQSIIMLGLAELKKWICLMYVHETNIESNTVTNEIAKMSMTRGKASELIAIKVGKHRESSSYFLVGIFSLIDSLLNQPLEKILNQLPLDKEIKDTLLGYQTSYRDVLALVLAMEQGEWPEITKLSNKIKLTEQELYDIYLKAIKWTLGILGEMETTSFGR